jgi:bacterial/archaeal transporter family protein
MFSSWLLFALLALVLYGVAAVTQKMSTNHVSAELSFFWFGAAFVVIAGVILVAEPLNWHLPARTWCWTVLAGALNALGALASFLAYRTGGKASIVTPLAALYPITTVALAVPIFKEGVNLREAIGIVVALAAGVALSYEGDPALTKTSPS